MTFLALLTLILYILLHIFLPLFKMKCAIRQNVNTAFFTQWKQVEIYTDDFNKWLKVQ